MPLRNLLSVRSIDLTYLVVCLHNFFCNLLTRLANNILRETILVARSLRPLSSIRSGVNPNPMIV